MVICINGLGRMGRTILRQALLRGHTIKAINDVASFEILAYLIKFDSTHGEFKGDVRLDSIESKSTDSKNIESNLQDSTKIDSKTQKLIINNQEITITNHTNPELINFGECDIVIESSGKFLDSKSVEHHLKKGAKKVIISAPAKDSTKTFVLGVNHKQYAGEPIISNASCTTNCIAPLCFILDKHFGIESAAMTTIHSYTNDQNLLDNAHRSDKRRSRAAASNIIPTTTGAAIGLKRVLPQLEGKIHGQSLRVPVIDVSMADLNFYLRDDFSVESVHNLFSKYAQDSMKGILNMDTQYRVSSDFLGSTFSSIVAIDLTLKIGKMLKIMSWYDNESGYANRILDLGEYVLK